MQEKIEKKPCVFEIMASELVVLKLSLLRREYLSSAVNVLTNTYKALHLTKTDFFHSITFKMITKYGNGAVVQIATVFEPVYHVSCQRVL